MKSNKSVMFDKDSVKIKKETFDSMNKVIDESKKLNELKPKMKKVIDRTFCIFRHSHDFPLYFK